MTSERYARIREMSNHHQPDLMVYMEPVHRPHNVSAFIRVADAVGVHLMHTAWPTNRISAKTIDFRYVDYTCPTCILLSQRKTSISSARAEKEQQRLLFEGDYPALACVAKRKGFPRPYIGHHGQVIADSPWSAMQSTRQ
ncbi:hypothetical protein PCO82_21880 [Pectobacteriaceae bacterium CE90]|nr:hypothetical protein [Prodigiosinella sp. LS101]WJV53952.1 hypothetical protein PCO85_00180 [Prodigiosinella sp. LS101]WJV58314.1 hypothetical protein PCO84_00180 [Pectobacteriaceae bacterium C111]WJY15053.1 hypothetical protein PCO82_21880 [Pectobacteriaceae bacterium CE90]